MKVISISVDHRNIKKIIIYCGMMNHTTKEGTFNVFLNNKKFSNILKYRILSAL